MDKRKTVFTTVVIGAGIMAIIDRIKLHNKVEELEEKTAPQHSILIQMRTRYEFETMELKE